MLVYGWLFGVPLLYDEVHDEVFLKNTGLVVQCNGGWCFSDDELREIIKGYKNGFDVEVNRL